VGNLYKISRNAKELLVIPGLSFYEEQLFLYVPLSLLCRLVGRDAQALADRCR